MMPTFMTKIIDTSDSKYESIIKIEAGLTSNSQMARMSPTLKRLQLPTIGCHYKVGVISFKGYIVVNYLSSQWNQHRFRYVHKDHIVFIQLHWYIYHRLLDGM